MTTLKMKTLALSLLFLIISTGIKAQNISNASAMDKAGRQRMLSQKMMKSYLMIGAGIKVESAKKELDAAVASFEENFLELQDFAPNTEIEESLLAVEDLWMPYRMQIVSDPNKEDALALLSSAGNILTACQQVVENIESYTKINAAKLVSTAGKQRMLSQKIAMYYTAYYWEISQEENSANLVSSVREFESALEQLKNSAENTEEINKELNRIEKQWQFSKKGFDLSSGRLMPSVISVTTNSILKKMNKVTGLYVNIMDNLVVR